MRILVVVTSSIPNARIFLRMHLQILIYSPRRRWLCSSTVVKTDEAVVRSLLPLASPMLDSSVAVFGGFGMMYPQKGSPPCRCHTEPRSTDDTSHLDLSCK